MFSDPCGSEQGLHARHALTQRQSGYGCLGFRRHHFSSSSSSHCSLEFDTISTGLLRTSCALRLVEMEQDCFGILKVCYSSAYSQQ